MWEWKAERVPEIPENATPLALLAAAVLLMAWTAAKCLPAILGRFRNGRNGPERRVGNQELKSGIAENSAQIAGLHRRFEQLEERERQGDTETARELGALTATVSGLEKIVGQTHGYWKQTRDAGKNASPLQPQDIKE